MIKLNLGCGSVRPNGWINTDSSLNANLQRIPLIGKPLARIFNPVQYDSSNLVYMNLNKTWNYESNSVDIVYASHLFEHLTLKSADLFLKEAYRTLKPGGVMRIVVPDLYQIVTKYLEDYKNASESEDPTTYIMWAINMHREGQYGNLNWLRKIVHEWQGYPHQHKFMYDPKSLKILVSKYGFKEPLLKKYGVSEYISDINNVEGIKESYLSVYLEVKK
jgi:predicted SAM-dependent methyltransferase